MEKHRQPMLGRRDMLRALTAGAVAVTAASAPHLPAQAEANGKGKEKPGQDKARYHANSPEVQTFYRVNRYPTQCGNRPC
jgi:hypothetical protein